MTTCKSMLLSHTDGVQLVDQQVGLLQLVQLTISNQTPRLESTKVVLDNQPITVTTLTQHPMLSETSSLIPTLVSANGGKFNSTNNIGLTESRS
jgi:hypothetical protein